MGLLYNVVAEVRRQRAAGVYHKVWFTVEVPAVNPDRETIRDAWFKQHGTDWELNHIIGFSLKEPEEKS